MERGCGDLSNKYWQYISTLTPAESEEGIRELFKDSFDIVCFYLNDIYYVSANIIFMSYVCDVPQKNIGKVYGISQYGVSKQVRSAKRKIKFSVLKPEGDSVRVRKDLDLLLPECYAETVTLYYFLHMYSLVAKVLGEITEGAIRSRLRGSLEILRCLGGACDVEEYKRLAKSLGVKGGDYEWGLTAAKRYYSYLKDVVDLASYGDHQFKKRVKKL